MTWPRITHQRRLFVEALGQSSQTTFSTLRDTLVWKGSNKMDLATLYRIVEVFKNQWLIHEIDIAGERVIFPCRAENTSTRDAVSVSFCENCGMIYDEHTPLPVNQNQSYTQIRLKSCPACMM